MAGYRLSRATAASIATIYEYSLLNFGEPVADDYFSGLHDAFRRLADFPQLGRECSVVREACRRLEYRSHVVFYVVDDDGVLILDVLGRAQDPLRHL